MDKIVLFRKPLRPFGFVSTSECIIPFIAAVLNPDPELLQVENRKPDSFKYKLVKKFS